jgi:hypothetical protein
LACLVAKAYWLSLLFNPQAIEAFGVASVLASRLGFSLDHPAHTNMRFVLFSHVQVIAEYITDSQAPGYSGSGSSYGDDASYSPAVQALQRCFERFNSELPSSQTAALLSPAKLLEVAGEFRDEADDCITDMQVRSL